MPGFGADDLVREVRGLLGKDAGFRVDSFDPCPDHLDLGLFETLAAAVRTQDPEAVPVPFVTMATTDGRHFARVGIQSCGHTPMELPAGYDFATMAHGADERIPVGAIDCWTEVVYRVLETCGPTP